jgi:hypothetical protein
MSHPIRRTSAFVLCLLAAAAAAHAQPVLQYKGLDSRVDYAALKSIGPWDDRNYQLTADDLELLAENEAELKAQIPAFFRVELRKGIPEMRRTGPVQYPRSALQIFEIMYGGYLVDGKIYQGATFEDGVYEVLTERGGVPEKQFWVEKFLDGEVRVTSPTGAAESAIKINPIDTDLVVAGSNGPGSGHPGRLLAQRRLDVDRDHAPRDRRRQYPPAVCKPCARNSATRAMPPPAPPAPTTTVTTWSSRSIRCASTPTPTASATMKTPARVSTTASIPTATASRTAATPAREAWS